MSAVSNATSAICASRARIAVAIIARYRPLSLSSMLAANVSGVSISLMSDVRRQKTEHAVAKRVQMSAAVFPRSGDHLGKRHVARVPLRIRGRRRDASGSGKFLQAHVSFSGSSLRSLDAIEPHVVEFDALDTYRAVEDFSCRSSSRKANITFHSPEARLDFRTRRKAQRRAQRRVRARRRDGRRCSIRQ